MRPLVCSCETIVCFYFLGKKEKQDYGLYTKCKCKAETIIELRLGSYRSTDTEILIK